MILIFAPVLTSRLQYIFRFMLEDIAGADISFTSDKEEFIQYGGAKFSYNHSPVAKELFFVPSGLLTERGITEKQIISVTSGGTTGLFPVRATGALPFDAFSAAFYLVTRYEEYLPHKKDIHKRFEAAQSYLVKEELIEKPLVDQWAYLIRDLIAERFPEEKFRQRKFRFISTIDVDSAFAYKEKGLIRTAGAIARSVSKFDFKDIRTRSRVLSGLEKDPYDSFEKQAEIQKKYGFQVIYFILVADYGINNKNISHMSDRFRKLVKSLGDHSKIGIHPGYNSGMDLKLLRKEIERLESIVKREIHLSRQHFLRISFPLTYRNLIEAGIQNDYSMGYAARCGFRAGTCTPFRFYDLDFEAETQLVIHPFTYMEGTLVDYMKLRTKEAKKKIRELMAAVKEVNGTFISLWHNESLGGSGRWADWESLYEFTAREAYNYRDGA